MAHWQVVAPLIVTLGFAAPPAPAPDAAMKTVMVTEPAAEVATGHVREVVQGREVTRPVVVVQSGLTERVWLALITGAGAAIPLLIPVAMAYIKSREAALAAEGAALAASHAVTLGTENAAGIAGVHLVINGRVTELLEAAKALAHAQGVVAGRVEEAQAAAVREQKGGGEAERTVAEAQRSAAEAQRATAEAQRAEAETQRVDEGRGKRSRTRPAPGETAP